MGVSISPPAASGAATPRASSTAFAVATPIPGTVVISSTLAARSRDTEPKCVTSALRRCSPNPRTESSAEAVMRLDRLLRWNVIAKR